MESRHIQKNLHQLDYYETCNILCSNDLAITWIEAMASAFGRSSKDEKGFSIKLGTEHIFLKTYAQEHSTHENILLMLIAPESVKELETSWLSAKENLHPDAAVFVSPTFTAQDKQAIEEFCRTNNLHFIALNEDNVFQRQHDLNNALFQKIKMFYAEVPYIFTDKHFNLIFNFNMLTPGRFARELKKIPELAEMALPTTIYDCAKELSCFLKTSNTTDNNIKYALLSSLFSFKSEPKKIPGLISGIRTELEKYQKKCNELYKKYHALSFWTRKHQIPDDILYLIGNATYQATFPEFSGMRNK